MSKYDFWGNHNRVPHSKFLSECQNMTFGEIITAFHVRKSSENVGIWLSGRIITAFHVQNYSEDHKIWLSGKIITAFHVKKFSENVRIWLFGGIITVHFIFYPEWGIPGKILNVVLILLDTSLSRFVHLNFSADPPPRVSFTSGFRRRGDWTINEWVEVME